MDENNARKLVLCFGTGWVTIAYPNTQYLDSFISRLFTIGDMQNYYHEMKKVLPQMITMNVDGIGDMIVTDLEAVTKLLVRLGFIGEGVFPVMIIFAYYPDRVLYHIRGTKKRDGELVFEAVTIADLMNEDVENNAAREIAHSLPFPPGIDASWLY